MIMRRTLATITLGQFVHVTACTVAVVILALAGQYAVAGALATGLWLSTLA